jgi:N-acetylglutamate synthase-like GNAT family acetyltransferase
MVLLCPAQLHSAAKMQNLSSRHHDFRQNKFMPQLHIRRATVDDLPALKSLWAAVNLPGIELEGRLTEFHVVESHGVFAGALGVQITRQHARIHSEDYTDFSVADAARELFWERFQKLAANHGVFRAWTQETSPFWTHWGFQPANAETLERLPDEWKSLEGGWLTLELKNEEVINRALKTQFAGFMETEKKQTAQMAASARKISTFFTVIFFVIGLIGIAIAVYLLLHHPISLR